MSATEQAVVLRADVQALQGKFGTQVLNVYVEGDMPTVWVHADAIEDICIYLRDTQKYEQLMDVCGLDMSEYPGFDADGPRFEVVYHLLSVSTRQRLRLRAPVAERQLINSVAGVWPTANWFEREAYDMYGILFVNHPDLRRLLTDYGFEGHPLRKDFPLVGRVELFFDEAQWRCVYKPNQLKDRVLIPKTHPGVDRG